MRPLRISASTSISIFCHRFVQNQAWPGLADVAGFRRMPAGVCRTRTNPPLPFPILRTAHAGRGIVRPLRILTMAGLLLHRDHYAAEDEALGEEEDEKRRHRGDEKRGECHRLVAVLLELVEPHH